MHGLLHDIGIAVIAATVLGLLALFLRQPIILGYLIAGALVGPEVSVACVAGRTYARRTRSLGSTNRIA